MKFLYDKYILYDFNSIVRDCKYREIRRGNQEKHIEGEKENKREGERGRKSESGIDAWRMLINQRRDGRP